MKHIVIKLGGSVLRSPCDARAVLDILAGYPDPIVVVVSALKGVTERLAEVLSATGRRAALISDLRDEYCGFAAAFGAPYAAEAAARMQIERLFGALELLFARDAALSASPTVGGGKEDGSGEAARIFRARVLATGGRLAATCISLALVSIGRPAPVIEPGKLGLVARRSACPSSGREDEAAVDIAASAPRVRAALGVGRSAFGVGQEAFWGGRSAVVPGFYGVAEDGNPRLFGRGGSDYSAAAIAACLGAASCDLVKDVDGFYTADPALVEGARLVVELSYEEAEALARGGAKILHQSCIAPLRDAGVPLRILGCSSSQVRLATRVGLGRPGGIPGPRGVAMKRGPAGSAEITVAGRGSASRSAAIVLKAFEARGFQARAFFPGTEGASFRLLVEASRGDEALRVAHEALFG